MNAQHDDPVTAVIVNFRTPDLTRRAAASFRTFYPTTPLLLVDNGSGSADAGELRRLAEECGPATQTLILPRNIHHGPAMDAALHHVASPYVFFLDSDCTVNRGDILEVMTKQLEAAPARYAAGKKIMMDSRGFDLPENLGGHPYIRPICMLVRRETYLQLPPFRKHGAPCLENMRAAVREGFLLMHVPVEEYVTHEGRGTASRHGYRLGIRGKINHLLHSLGL
jgi:Glycosyl transferase family 2